MNSVKNILVIVDPTAKVQPALDKATRLAKALDARLQLFACETKQTRALCHASRPNRRRADDFVPDVYAVLDGIAEPVRKHGVDLSIEVIAGDLLFVQLLARMQATCPDLVVKDTHHHSLASRTFITNNDWQLIRGCPVPLLLAKSRPWSPAPVFAAAIDPGHAYDKPAALDNRILDWADDWRRRFRGSLHVVHAFLPTVGMTEAAGPGLTAQLAHERLDEKQRVKLNAVESMCAPYAIETKTLALEFGPPSDVLLRFAHDIVADVMIMGAISRGGMGRVLIGSTAERVLEHLPCDVLVVKPPDFAASLPL